MPTLIAWSCWLLLGSWLLGPRLRWLLIVAFPAAGAVLLTVGGFTWRAYLMSALAFLVVVAVSQERDGRSDVVAGGSYLGVIWLWVEGGARYFAIVAGVVAAAVLATAVVSVVRALRGRRGPMEARGRRPHPRIATDVGPVPVPVPLDDRAHAVPERANATPETERDSPGHSPADWFL